MSSVKINDLKKTGKELNAFLFEDGNEQINIKASGDVLTIQVIQAINLLEPGEEAEFTETAQAVIEALKTDEDYAEAREEAKDMTEAEEDDAEAMDVPEEEPVKPAKKQTEPIEEEEEEDGDDSLEGMVKKCTLVQLKELVKEESVFTPLRKGLGLQNNVEKLREKMLAFLGASEEEEVEKPTPKPAKKETTKPAPVTKEKKEKITKKSVIEEALIKGATVEEMAAKMVELGIDSDLEKNKKVTVLWLSKMGYSCRKADMEKNPIFKAKK